MWHEFGKYFLKEKLNDFIDFLKNIGVMHKLEIIKTSIWNNPKKQDLLNGFGNSRLTNSAINEDYIIEGIEKYLERVWKLIYQ